MNAATLLVLAAVMGLLMGCAEAPQRVQMSRNCYTEESARGLPVLYCHGRPVEAIPAAELVSR